MGYYNNVNPDLLKLIPPDARVVLEIGCGTGALAKAYRRINPYVAWCGIEKNDEAANIAEDRGIDIRGSDVEVIVGDVAPWIDVLIFGDVLEHLHDPWKSIQNTSKMVKPGGQVLACIPNVAHYSIVLGLLRGEWDYQNEGLLDRTHLRFFTLKSIRAMFAQAGLDIFEIRGRNWGFDETEWRRLVNLAGWTTDSELAIQARTPQYLVRAVKPPCEIERLHIHAVGDGTVCLRPRILEPLAMLETIPGVMVSIDPFPMDGRFPRSSVIPVPEDCDSVLIVQRYRGVMSDYRDGLRRIVENRPRCLVIADWDDDPEGLVGADGMDYLGIRGAHAVMVPTEVMAETVRQWNPHVAVFPNQIADLPPLLTRRTELLTIFFGALNRKNDWKPIMPALNRVLADHSDVHVRVVNDREFFAALETTRKDFTEFSQYKEYRRILGTCDIALLPLTDTRFNRHKSDIKFLECATEGVAVLASYVAIGQFAPMVTNDMYRCYFSPEHMERGLRILITNANVKKDQIRNAYAYVRNHRLLSQHYRARLEWFRELLRSKPDLDKSLMDRCPEIRPNPTRSAPIETPVSL